MEPLVFDFEVFVPELPLDPAVFVPDDAVPEAVSAGSIRSVSVKVGKGTNRADVVIPGADEEVAEAPPGIKGPRVVGRAREIVMVEVTAEAEVVEEIEDMIVIFW